MRGTRDPRIGSRTCGIPRPDLEPRTSDSPDRLPPHHRLRPAGRHRTGGDRRQLPRRQGRNAVPGRRIRQRQVGDGAVDPPARRSAGPHRRRDGALRRARPAGPRRARDAGGARAGHLAHLPGADDGAEPGLHDRQPDRRDADGPRRRTRARRAAARDRAADGREHAGSGATRSRLSRTSSPAACASAR